MYLPEESDWKAVLPQTESIIYVFVAAHAKAFVHEPRLLYGFFASHEDSPHLRVVKLKGVPDRRILSPPGTISSCFGVEVTPAFPVSIIDHLPSGDSPVGVIIFEELNHFHEPALGEIIWIENGSVPRR